MSLPDYIKTEWKSRGHVLMKFVNSNDYPYRAGSTENEQQQPCLINRDDNSVQNFPAVSKTLVASASGALDDEVPVLFAVECYLSTHNVWEYQEAKEYSDESSDALSVEENSLLSVDEGLNGNVSDLLQDSCEEIQDTVTKEEKSEEEAVEIPPSISDDIWQQWLVHWGEWMDNYVNLAWIQRFPELSKDDSRDWHQKYISDNPFILSYINYCPDIHLEREGDIKEHNLEAFVHSKQPEDESKREIMNRLYDEFQSKRYWPHLRLFLRDVGHNISNELQEFFLTRHITDEPAAGLEQPEYPESKLEMSEDERLVQSALDVFVDKIDRETEKEYLRETTQKFEEEDSNKFVTISKNGSGTKGEENTFNDIHKKKKKKSCNKKGKNGKNRGVAWALEHVQKLASETGCNQSGNEPYLFGISQSENVAHSVVSFPKSHIEGEQLLDDRSLAKKRKLEEGDHAAFVHNEDSSVVARSSYQLWLSNVFQGLQMQFHRMLGIFTYFKKGIVGIFNAIAIPFVEVNYNSFIFGVRIPRNWFLLRWMSKSHLKQEEVSYSYETKALKNFKNLFKPVVRKFPLPPLMTASEVKLNQVLNKTNARSIKEELVKVYGVECEDAENERRELYVLYLTEEDIDDILADVVELSIVAEKCVPIHNKQIIFDEEGNPQTILKVPADAGKKLFLVEENLKNGKRNSCETESGDEKQGNGHTLDNKFEDWLYQVKIVYDDEGNPVPIPNQPLPNGISLHQKINNVLKSCFLIRHSKEESKEVPEHIAEALSKYWYQRYRLFLRYDQGIKLDDESWYSVTPEMIASHQAERCTCETVIDAFCGAGGNAIQLAATCKKVIAIDIDPAKIAIARHNAEIYGVLDQIEFIEGDFFALAHSLKADVVLLSPPWSGIEYQKEEFYDIYKLGGLMDGRKLFETAKSITPNIALYIPKNTNIFQVIELAGPNGKVDLEYNHISNKRKSLTAYYGDLVNYHC